MTPEIQAIIFIMKNKSCNVTKELAVKNVKDTPLFSKINIVSALQNLWIHHRRKFRIFSTKKVNIRKNWVETFEFHVLYQSDPL